MRFHVEANCVFEAQDIDDALLKLGNHLLSSVSDSGLSIDEELIECGSIDIHPLKEMVAQ
jgi:hypothetical protein